MEREQPVHSQEEAQGAFRSYTTGFLFSIVLTAVPAAVVWGEWLAGNMKAIVLMAAAVLQLIVQLVYFMHLREEKKPRYNLISLLLGIVILIVIVAGSMWIMLYNTVAV